MYYQMLPKPFSWTASVRFTEAYIENILADCVSCSLAEWMGTTWIFILKHSISI